MNSYSYIYIYRKLKYLLIAAIFFSGISCGIFNSWKVPAPFGTESNDPVFADGVQYDAEGRLIITQYGITWYFDAGYTYGNFANGDYYVIGPVTITSIYPAARKDYTNRWMNGSMINPSPLTEESTTVPGVYYYNQGYDSACEFIAYNSSRNVALNLPLSLLNGTSLISTRSRTWDEIYSDPEGNKTRIKSAAVLTVVATPPPAGSFRPPYAGTDKSFTYNTSTIFGTGGTISHLKKLAPVTNTPSLATVERYFERPWIDHAVESWTNRTFRPMENMPEYHREMANIVGIGALMLHLNFTDAEKQTLLIRYVQVGIDFYRIYQLGKPRYPGESAAGAARKWPILFAGIMLNDTGMQGIGARSGYYIYSNYPTNGPGNAQSDYDWFGEDTQILHVTAEDVARTHDTAKWKPDYRTPAPEAYEAGDIGMPEWGVHHVTDPYQSDRSWEATYRQCCSLYAWIGYILAARIMESDCGTMTLWNNPDLFNYADRYMAVTAESTLNPVWRTSITTPLWGTHTVNEVWGTDPGWRYFSYFNANMWDEYRDNY